MANYTGQVNWGDWQQMPDYRAGWKDKNKSSIAGIGRALDVTTYIPGLNKVSDFVHEGTDRAMTTLNRVAEPIVTAESKILGKYDPVRYSLGKTFPSQHESVTGWVNTHGADAAAIAAATYFTAGAAGSALGGAGGAAAGSGSAAGAGGAAAGTGAASGTGGLTALGTAAITPAFESAAGAGISSAAAGGAAAAGYGGLGAAGTAAATSMITPALASLGTAGSGAGLLSSLKAAYGKVSPYTDMAKNINRFASANRTPTDRERYSQQAGAMADRVLNAGAQPVTTRQRVARQMMNNRYGMR